jgi:hypothetical protein
MLRFPNRLRVPIPSRPTKVRRRHSARPAFEPLESRRLRTVASFIVWSTGDTGPGSLRQALISANNFKLANPTSSSTIMFEIGSGAQTIAPNSPLPPVPSGTLLDGSTQPGFFYLPLITLDGSNAGSSASGLQRGGSCTVRDLVIDDFAQSGLVLGGSGNNVVQANYIGIDHTGTLARGNLVGVTIPSSSGSNTIGGTTVAARNIISGNVLFGVDVAGSASNVIASNQIGTDPIGTKALGNAVGVYLSDNANNNWIGVETLNPARNTISGNREGYGQELCLANSQAAGFSLMPSMKTVPLMTSASSGEPFNDRQPFDAASISLETIARHAARLPFPLVLSCLSRTVEKTLSIGLVVRMCSQCSAG